MKECVSCHAYFPLTTDEGHDNCPICGATLTKTEIVIEN